MGDYAWFKLLVRAIGILLLGLSVPLILWTIGSILLEQFGYAYPGQRSGDLLLVRLPGVVGYGAQAGMGVYLLFGAQQLIEMCIAGVRYRCAACGYDIVGIQTGLCPECGTGIPLPRTEPKPPSESVH